MATSRHAQGQYQSALRAMTRLALVVSAIAVLSCIEPLPTPIKALAAGLFIFIGPGAAIIIWNRGLPQNAEWPLIPLLGVSVIIVASYIASLEGWWHPAGLMLVLILMTVASVLVWENQRGFWGERRRLATAETGEDDQLHNEVFVPDLKGEHESLAEDTGDYTPAGYEPVPDYVPEHVSANDAPVEFTPLHLEPALFEVARQEPSPAVELSEEELLGSDDFGAVSYSHTVEPKEPVEPEEELAPSVSESLPVAAVLPEPVFEEPVLAMPVPEKLVPAEPEATHVVPEPAAERTTFMPERTTFKPERATFVPEVFPVPAVAPLPVAAPIVQPPPVLPAVASLPELPILPDLPLVPELPVVPALPIASETAVPEPVAPEPVALASPVVSSPPLEEPLPVAQVPDTPVRQTGYVAPTPFEWIIVTAADIAKTVMPDAQAAPLPPFEWSANPTQPSVAAASQPAAVPAAPVVAQHAVSIENENLPSEYGNVEYSENIATAGRHGTEEHQHGTEELQVEHAANDGDTNYPMYEGFADYAAGDDEGTDTLFDYLTSDTSHGFADDSDEHGQAHRAESR